MPDPDPESINLDPKHWFILGGTAAGSEEVTTKRCPILDISPMQTTYVTGRNSTCTTI